MLVTVKNQDLICYQLRSNLYPQLENPLKKDIDKLSEDVTHILTSGKQILHSSIELRAQFFNLRIKAIKWLSKGKNFDYLKTLSEVSNKIEEIGKNIKMEILKENILFALRCCKRIADGLFREHDQIHRLNFDQLPDITYQEFLASLSFGIPNNETAQKIAEFTNASLHIEFVMLSVGLMNEKKSTYLIKPLMNFRF